MHVGVDTGVYSEDLVVNGDSRITGILTVGTSSLTLDGNNNTVQVGTALTLGHTQGIQFHSQSLHASGLDVNNINVTGITTLSTLNTSGAFYMPQYTTTARDAGSFNEGAMIYNTSTKKMEFYDGTNWIALPGMSLGLTVALDG